MARNGTSYTSGTAAIQAALRSAAVRGERKRLKEDLAARRVFLDELLSQHPTDAIAGMRVLQLLSAVPGIGESRKARIVRAARITGATRLDTLSFDSRTRLIAELTEQRARYERNRGLGA